MRENSAPGRLKTVLTVLTKRGEKSGNDSFITVLSERPEGAGDPV